MIWIRALTKPDPQLGPRERGCNLKNLQYKIPQSFLPRTITQEGKRTVRYILFPFPMLSIFFSLFAILEKNCRPKCVAFIEFVFAQTLNGRTLQRI